jgi:hypothetical protein
MLSFFCNCPEYSAVTAMLICMLLRLLSSVSNVVNAWLSFATVFVINANCCWSNSMLNAVVNVLNLHVK